MSGRGLKRWTGQDHARCERSPAHERARIETNEGPDTSVFVSHRPLMSGRGLKRGQTEQQKVQLHRPLMSGRGLKRRTSARRKA